MEGQGMPGVGEIRALFIFFWSKFTIRPMALWGMVEQGVTRLDGWRGFLAAFQLLCRFAVRPSALQAAE